MSIKKYSSFEELQKAESQTENLQSDKKQKAIKQKPLYDENDIVAKNKQFATKDGNYETYTIGLYTSWKVTIIGNKNGAKDIGNNINDGYLNASFENKNRAAQLLMNLINSK